MKAVAPSMASAEANTDSISGAWSAQNPWSTPPRSSNPPADVGARSAAGEIAEGERWFTAAVRLHAELEGGHIAGEFGDGGVADERTLDLGGQTRDGELNVAELSGRVAAGD